MGGGRGGRHERTGLQKGARVLNALRLDSLGELRGNLGGVQ